MLELLRVMLPYLLLVCVAAVFMGMLNARGHFFIPSIGAATMNLVMIASVLWLAPVMGRELHEQIFALAIGVVAAGVAQAAFQLPTLHRDGYRFQWVWPWRDDTVRRVVQQMLPAIIGVAAYQVNVLLTQGIAFWVDAQIVASFNYAVRLMELPQGVFGVSMATYLLPTLAGLAAEKKYPEFRTTLRQGLGMLLFASLIAADLLVVLAGQIIRLLFERENSPRNPQMLTFALVCLAPELLAFSAVNVLARAFFALTSG
jgi:putative peptidoglycan lipid II flippase